LRLGLRLDQVGQTFRLREIDPAILERPAGELSRLGEAKAVDPPERRQHRSDDRAATMQLQLDHILAGLACGSVEA
jgi:hypothetical protein